MMIPVVAALITVTTLISILIEKGHRALVAMMGAVIMVLAGLLLGFYSYEQSIMAIEFDALGLLLGMMILVSILDPTGAFQYAAIKIGQLSKGDPWRLMFLLAIGTSLISMVISNVTTIVLVGPVIILITELIGFSPIPFLMAATLLSATSGIGTSIGDPASLIISVASGNSFTDFLTHAMPIVIVAGLVSLLMLRVLFSKELSKSHVTPEVVERLDAKEALKDRETALRVLIMLGIAVVLFVFQEPLGLHAGFIALAVATVALLWVQTDLHEVLGRIDWSVILFLIGLFVLIGGLENAGALDPIITALIGLGHDNPVLLGVVIIWVVAGLSALLDNIPATIAMISLLNGLQATGVDVDALWWAVVFGAGFGGNATPIGSSANIVAVALSERSDFPITFKMWSKIGLPIAIVTCVVGSVLYTLAFTWLSR
jgi:Na+/H+ antiporter NhaD/arsenite permease-like protein